MDNQNPGGRKPWEQHLNEALPRLEEELRRVVRYVDEEVVPEVRRNGSKGLRTAADWMRKLADQMDEQNSPPTSSTSSENSRS